MDIRKFFRKATTTLKRKKGCDSSSGSEDNIDKTRSPSSSKADTGQLSNSSASAEVAAPGVESSPSTSEQVSASVVNPEIEENDGCHENDLGCYVEQAFQLTVEKKKEFLKSPWAPPKNYNFAIDASHFRRKFNHAWLDKYSPWLVYSKRLKGTLCKHCVLFPPATGTVRGVLGSFIISPFTKFKDVHEDCRNHVATNFHKTATAAAKAFLEDVPVDVQVQSFQQNIIKENKQILSSIISCVVFCGTHDMPLRGKEADEGVFFDLRNLRIDSGDKKLKDHLEKCRRNAVYTSQKIQNELIGLCGEVIRENVINDAKKAMAYAVLADETADISGKEQLSIGLHFCDESQGKIREKFTGFVELKSQNAPSIAEAIDNFLVSYNFSPENCRIWF